MQKKQIFRTAEWIALAGMLAASILLLSYITLYSDDYQYATFFDDGLKSFWTKTVDHYLTCNGRALVHFFAEVFLLFGTKLYAFLFPFMMGAAFYLSRKSQCEDGTPFSPGMVAVALGILLALTVFYLNQTLLWVAGSFNYCFPALLFFGYFAAAQRAIRDRGTVLACLLGFLAGATTEQNGLAALVGGILIAGGALIRAPREKRPWRSLIPIVFVLCGYLTVMFAPGTFSRISADGEQAGALSILLNPPLLASRFYSVMSYFFGTGRSNPGAAWLLTLLILLLGFLPLIRRRKFLRPLLAGLPVAFFYLLLLQLNRPPFTAAAGQLLVFVYLAFAGILLFFDSEFSVSGTFILAGLASIGIMIFTNLGAYRTVVPTLILLIAVTVRLGEIYLAQLPDPARISVGAAAVLLCLLAAVPTFDGYRANSAVIRKNEEAIASGLEKGEIVLCTDYLDNYRHTLMYEGAYFFTFFRRAYDIPQDFPVFLEGEHYAHWPVTVDGIPLRMHSAMTHAVLYLPMRDLFDSLGVSFAWDFAGGNGFHINYNGEQYFLSKLDNTITRVSDGEVIVDECYTTGFTDRDYILVSAAAEFFGFTYTFDWQSVAISTGGAD